MGAPTWRDLPGRLPAQPTMGRAHTEGTPLQMKQADQYAVATGRDWISDWLSANSIGPAESEFHSRLVLVKPAEIIHSGP